MKAFSNNGPFRASNACQNPKCLQLWRLKTRRKRWLYVHLWLGLSLGLLLSIYGITGSILVFNAELDELLNRNLLTVIPPSSTTTFQPLAAIFDAGRQAMPKMAQATFATYPRNAQAAFVLNYSKAVPGNIDESWQVAVDPYTAQVIGKRLLSSSNSNIPNTLIGFIFTLHYALLLSDGLSALVVGVTAALLIISVLTGIILWWPLTGRWWQALTIKPKASGIRFNYDLHKTSGFYTALVMLPVLFSGIYMVLPEKVVPVLELFSPVTYRYGFQSTPPASNTQPIGMHEAVAIAAQRYPNGRPNWIYGAPEPTNAYTICLDDVDAPGSLLQRRCVVLDRYSGNILDVDDPTKGTAGEVFTQWQWPLHSGRAFGMTGRILVFITGLACPLIFITGVIRWLQKRRARKSKETF
jgi:uncharacterized iron-regulated membrane protein